MLRLLNPSTDIIVHGAAPGADRLVGEMAWGLGFTIKPYPANWAGPCRSTCKPGHRRTHPSGEDYCPAAGNYQNQEMLDAGADLVVALQGGSGTADMCRRAEEAGVEVRRWPEWP